MKTTNRNPSPTFRNRAIHGLCLLTMIAPLGVHGMDPATYLLRETTLHPWPSDGAIQPALYDLTTTPGSPIHHLHKENLLLKIPGIPGFATTMPANGESLRFQRPPESEDSWDPLAIWSLSIFPKGTFLPELDEVHLSGYVKALLFRLPQNTEVQVLEGPMDGDPLLRIPVAGQYPWRITYDLINAETGERHRTREYFLQFGDELLVFRVRSHPSIFTELARQFEDNLRSVRIEMLPTQHHSFGVSR